MALEIGESHILASHSGVGKAGGAEPPVVVLGYTTIY